jgi:hypothetical protein
VAVKRALFMAGALLTAGCGIGVQRDLSAQTPSAVVFDDACGLQQYFDAMATSMIAAPTEVAGQELERADGKRAAGGRTRIAFRTEFQLEQLRRLLRQNWKRVPPEVLKAREVFVEVRWSQRAGVRRVVTTEDAELSLDANRSWSLPYHVCLSDFLFGSSLYRTRREMLGLPALAPSTLAAKRAPPRDAPAGSDPQAMGSPIPIGPPPATQPPASVGATPTAPPPVAHP